MAPKRVRLCPSCPAKDLSLDVTPQFKFINNMNNSSKKITIINNVTNKIKSKVSSLF